MPKSLSDALIRAIQPPEHGQVTVVDGALPNFGVRVSQGGARTFIVTLGKGKRQTLGRYPILSLADARAEARRILAEKTLGHVRPNRIPFDQCRAEYLKECGHRLKSGSLRLYTYHLTRDFPFGKQPIAEITARQIIDNLNRCTPSMKEHAARIGRSFFLWAVRNHYLESSPMARIRPAARGKSRERILTTEELKSVLRTAQRLTGPYPTIVELCLRLGQRRGEIAATEWEWIDWEGKTLTFPSEITKNKRKHAVPLTDMILNVLLCHPRLSDTYVFPATRERRAGQPSTIFNSWSKSKEAFDKQCGVTGWVLHDLRRTVSSGMASLGVAQVVVEKLLNHISEGSQSQIAAIYNRHAYMEEMRIAVQLWESHLKGLTDDQLR